jgi:acyl-CoA thioester hydrolase
MRTSEMPWADVEMEIPFHDIDPMGIVWHGRYPKYFEVARCKLLDEIGYNYDDMSASGYSWPVIDMHIRYPRPLRFRQKVKVRCEIVEYDNRLRLKYLITDSASGQRMTKGETVQVAVSLSENEMQFASPPVLEEKIRGWSD